MNLTKRSLLWGFAALTLLWVASGGGAPSLLLAQDPAPPARAEAEMDPLPMPLPEFTLTRLDGTPITSQQLRLQDNRLLIYTTTECAACDRLLRLINKEEFPDLPSRVIVVVSGATHEQVKNLLAKFPDLAGAAWYADPSENGSAALKLPGMPVVFGLQQQDLHWCVLGILSDEPTTMKSILASWLQPHNPNALTSDLPH